MRPLKYNHWRAKVPRLVARCHRTSDHDSRQASAISRGSHLFQPWIAFRTVRTAQVTLNKIMRRFHTYGWVDISNNSPLQVTRSVHRPCSRSCKGWLQINPDFLVFLRIFCFQASPNGKMYGRVMELPRCPRKSLSRSPAFLPSDSSSKRN